tara:strand:+ start:83 stop:841 length:759 start_codon:yes stop_codon:yes gene_type:complete
MARPRSMRSKETGQKARRLRAAGLDPKDVPARTGPYMLKEGITGEKKKSLFGDRYKLSGPSKTKDPFKYQKRVDKQLEKRLDNFDRLTVMQKDKDYDFLSRKQARGQDWSSNKERRYYRQLDTWFKGKGRVNQLIREDGVLAFFKRGKDALKDRRDKRRKAEARNKEIQKKIDAEKAESARIKLEQKAQKREAVRESIPGFRTAERKGKDISMKLKNFKEARKTKKEKAKNKEENMPKVQEKAVRGRYTYKI